MSGFDEAWKAVASPRDGESVSPKLRPLLHTVYIQCLSEPLNPAALKKGLEDLLAFLVQDGRTNANCWAADSFFALGRGWERDWSEKDFPEGFHDVLVKMGEALHDTVRAPEIASAFNCLPEQILERVRQLPDG